MKNHLQSFILTALFFFAINNLIQAQAPNWQWALGAGLATTDEIGYGVTADASGNVYTTGSFGCSTLSIGTASLNMVGLGNVFVTKQDAAGNILWATKFGGISASVGGGSGTSICLDASGNVYVTGYYINKLVAGTTTLTSSDTTATNVGDIFIVKLDGSGNVIWAKSAGGTVGDFPAGIAVDGSSNVFLTGVFKSHTISFGSISLISPNNLPSGFFVGTDIFVAKYDPSGTPVWAKNAGTAGADYGKGISVDAAGNVLVTGTFYLTPIAFGTTTLTASGATNLFVVKYDNSGNVVWGKTASGSGSGAHVATSISTDGSNNAYITGCFAAATLSLGTVVINNPGGGNALLIAKLDASGNYVWARYSGTGTTGISYGTGISTDGSGNSYVCGYFDGTKLVIGTSTLTNNNTGGNNEDIFVTKYDASGNFSWAKSVGGIYRDISNGIGVDGSGNAVVTGKLTSPSVAFGTNTITTGGSGVYNDIFIAKLGNGVGIKENKDNSISVSVFPNPFNSSATLQLNTELNNGELSLFNLCGQKVKSINSIKGNTLSITRDNLPNGIYFIQLVQNGKTLCTQKLIIAD